LDEFLFENDFVLANIEFSGLCDCTLIMHSGKNPTGCYAELDNIDDDTFLVVDQEIWPRAQNPKSFSVACVF